LDQLQADLSQSRPDLEIQILGMNAIGHESGNATFTEGRTIPWLQDVDANSDGESDNWLTSWPFTYRDVVIVDSANRVVTTYNVTEHNLKETANYEQLRALIIDAAEAVPVATWTNPDDPLDVNDDTVISAIDALLILNEINSPAGPRQLDPPTSSSAPPPYVDTSGDGFVSAIDALLVINYINAHPVSAQPVAAQPVAALPAQAAIQPAGRPAAVPLDSALVAAAVDRLFDRSAENRVS
jgi:hypothetical protein